MATVQLDQDTKSILLQAHAAYIKRNPGKTRPRYQDTIKAALEKYIKER